MSENPYGQVITFYSYKGGTGRTMALANVACLLARYPESKRGVLMIDWDLEAPGLHRFFYPGHLKRDKADVKLVWQDEPFEKAPGLIDFFVEIKEQIYQTIPENQVQIAEQAGEMLATIDLTRFVQPTEVDGVFLLKAGSFDDKYPICVNTFDWEALHNHSPWLFRTFAELLAEKYDYVLIDSRTGITDTSGICTMIMPEKLVVVFAPNQQSLTGIDSLVRKAIQYREQSDDLRQLVIFPLASRIEVNERELQEDWRKGNSAKGILGYQPFFEKLLMDVYELDLCELESYFDVMRIKQVPFYAYGEEISVLKDSLSNDLYPAYGYDYFTNALIYAVGPWSKSSFIKNPSEYAIQVGVARDVTIITSPELQQNINERAVQARRRYLERLIRQCQSLPLAVLGSDDSTEADVTLDKVYIDLNTTTPKEEKSKRAGGKSTQSEAQEISEELMRYNQVPLISALEAAAETRRLVLLGDPGAGKSSFVKKLLVWQSLAMLQQTTYPEGFTPDLLPILVSLRELAPFLTRHEVDYLPPNRLDEKLVQAVWELMKTDLGEACADFEAGLMGILQNGHCLLALDGLDEVPHDLRHRTRQTVEALLKTYNPARIIVTCRVRSYVGDAVLPAFTNYTLAPFDEQQIRDFTTAWYNTQKELGRVSETQAKERVADLSRAALGTDLRELSQNPMLLTTMAIIHQREVGLPRERVRLYHLAVEVLLRRWQKHKVGETELAAFLKDDLKLRAVVEALAYAAHRASTSTSGTGDLLRKDAISLLESSELLRNLQLAGEFLDYVDQRAGLLVGRGGELGKPLAYSFTHRTFQEYLAGAYLAGQRDLVRCFFEHAAESDSWDLAAQLAFEEMFYNRRGVNTLLDLAYHLCPGESRSAQGDRARLWSGQIAALVGRAAVERDTHPNGGTRFLQRLLPGLVEGLGGPLLPVERAEIGRSLCRLGDPRPEVMTSEQIPFCHVPGGKFLVGSDKHRNEQADDDEIPQHTLILPDFWVSRYPVTNAQFTEFVTAGGYQEKRYWAEAIQAKCWKNGAVIREIYTDQKWVKENGEKPYDYSEPFNLPNHPVVGVTWYEVLAFCRWLTERFKENKKPQQGSEKENILWEGILNRQLVITLPNETEWEKAASGLDVRRYPWGDDFDPNKANTLETGIGSNSTVGCFPSGVSPYGLVDMSGNVWEWTRSIYRPYPYISTDGREDLNGNEPRAIRGGSFVSPHEMAWCSARSKALPFSPAMDIGFRVAIVPTNKKGELK